MTTPMIGLIALLIISLVGWAIAELKNKSITFTHSEAEAEGESDTFVFKFCNCPAN